MRKASVAALVPLLAAALSAQAQQAASNGRQPGQGGQGVRVTLLAPSVHLHEPFRYELSEPGYVAAFIVYPGAGVRLLYPTIDTPEKLQSAGYHTDQLIGSWFDNDVYRAVLGPAVAGPSYLYIVASRNPLNVAQYVHHPTLLANAVGVKESRSFYTDVAFDALLNNAVALGDDTSWDSDMYILWPGTDVGDASPEWWDPSRRDNYRYDLCTDGTLRLVPINYPFIGCPGQAHLRLNPAAVQKPPVRSLASNEESPTVLPTIIGKPSTHEALNTEARRTESERRALRVEVANGDRQSSAGASDATAVQLHSVVVVPGDVAAQRRNRDELHGQYSPERRARNDDEQRMRRRDAELAAGPRLSPNPSLPPNPSLSPNPGFERLQQPERARPSDESQQARQQFREARQEQAQERQRQSEQRAEQPVRQEPMRAAPPAQPSPSAAQASPRTDGAPHAGRVVDQ